MKNIVSIGADLGHSCANILWASNRDKGNHHTIMIPTVVNVASYISDEETAKRAANETINYEGQNYFFGDTAMTHNAQSEFSGKEQNWIQSYVHDVMLLGSVKKVLDEMHSYNLPRPDAVVLMLGLPTEYFASQKAYLLQQTKKILGQFLGDIELYVNVHAQSNAPLYNIVFDELGEPNPNSKLDTDNCIIVDVGHFTIDYSMFWNKNVVAGGSIPNGVHTVYNKVRQEFLNNGYPCELSAITSAVTTGSIRRRGQDVNVMNLIKEPCEEICGIAMNQMKTFFNTRIDQVDAIYLVGGGAPIIFDYFKKEFENTYMMENPRWAVAEGLLRNALANLKFVPK